MVRSYKRSLLAAFAVTLVFASSDSFMQPLRAQLSTSDHLAEPGFWPTKHSRSREDYAGTAVCAQCHRSIAETQSRTSMYETARRADESYVLRSHPKMSFDAGSLHYEIDTKGGQSVYTATDGTRQLSAVLLWAFGTDRVGQSYLFKKEDGNLYEARVTYFATLQKLHFTPQRALASPKRLEEAMSRRVDAGEVDRCFSCHTTAPMIGERFEERGLIPGVTCEACHGPGEEHVEAMQAARAAGIEGSGQYIFNPARLIPADSVDFCGACHNTWWDVKLTGIKGVANVRAQPYRLEESKCWGIGDARITCMACHDPHVEVSTDISSYDHNCLNCHVASSEVKSSPDHPGKACPVGTRECASCHMPKVYDPEMHYDFRDHKIRIVKPGETYTD